ncbi:MAG: hypothetical protein U5L08_07790 [Xanthomonadales bacterium]|nr:hypothetical protein [Xanthomonadales bacterium]
MHVRNFDWILPEQVWMFLVSVQNLITIEDMEGVKAAELLFTSLVPSNDRSNQGGALLTLGHGLAELAPLVEGCPVSTPELPFGGLGPQENPIDALVRNARIGI